MDREGLNTLIRQGPVRIRMNNGDTYDVPSIEFATVGDIAAAVLVRGDDSKLRPLHLALVAMCSVEPLSAEAN